MKIFVNDRIDLGDLYSLITRSLSKDKHIKLKSKGERLDTCGTASK